MHLKLIACNVFQREACWCVARSPHVIDTEFTELGEHAHSAGLRELLQARIDEADRTGKYEAILLLFGLCGNSTVGLKARNAPLVIPRAHDCCTILLGSTEEFRLRFEDNPSRPFSSSGYMERGDYFLRVEDEGAKVFYGDGYAELVKQYGEEDAKYVWETLHPPGLELHDRKAVFIDLPETSELGFAEKFREKAEAEGKEYVRLDGNIRLIRGLIEGHWNPEQYLVVPPGDLTVGVYDWSEVITSRPSL
jgi:predicted secreted protein